MHLPHLPHPSQLSVILFGAFAFFAVVIGVSVYLDRANAGWTDRLGDEGDDALGIDGNSVELDEEDRS